LGVLYLLKKFDVIWFNWRDIISLWPLMLVLWGISLLPIKAMLKLIASLVTILAMILLISFKPVHWHSGWMWIGDFHKGRSIEYKQSESWIDSNQYARLDLNAVAGRYVISGTTDKLIDFKHVGDSGTYYMSTSVEDNRHYVSIGPESTKTKFTLYRAHEVDIKLNPALIWDIDIDAGAADIDLDLTPFIINDLSINGGATSLYIKLGERSDNIDLLIETGVSSVLIKVPEELACEVNSDSFLISKDLPGFDKVSKSTYVTPNFSSAEKNITIRFESGISSLRVIRY
jgi:hypothetical protein